MHCYLSQELGISRMGDRSKLLRRAQALMDRQVGACTSSSSSDIVEFGTEGGCFTQDSPPARPCTTAVDKNEGKSEESEVESFDEAMISCFEEVISVHEEMGGIFGNMAWEHEIGKRRAEEELALTLADSQLSLMTSPHAENKPCPKAELSSSTQQQAMKVMAAGCQKQTAEEQG